MSAQRLTLTLLWWIWGVALLICMIPLSLQPVIFGTDTQKVWQWLLPNILPTMTMVGAAAYADPKPNTATQPIVIFYFALATSIIYLILLTVSIVAGAFFSPKPLEALRASSLWLAPFQGFVSSYLAYHFIKK